MYASSEGNVAVRIPGELDLVGVLRIDLVGIGRSETGQDEVTLLDGAPFDFGVGVGHADD